MNRPLGAEAKQPEGLRQSLWFKIAVSSLIIGGLAFAVSRLNLRSNMSRLDLGVLSGSAEGNYHRLVQQMADVAGTEKGKLRNVSSEGSADNVHKLAAAATGCDVAIGLAQDGTAWGEKKPELIG